MDGECERTVVFTLSLDATKRDTVQNDTGNDAREIAPDFTVAAFYS